MTARRKLIITAAAAAAFVLVLLAAVPLLLRDRIAERVKAELGSRVAARVDWSDVTVSMLRDFPSVSLGLNDIVVSGIDRFAGDTLIAAEQFRIALDLGSVLQSVRGRGPLVVRSVELSEPAVRLTVLEDGAASWDILRPTADTMQADSAGGLAVSLRALEIRDARLVFDDRQADLHATLSGLQESLSGDFDRETFVLRTRTHADSVSVRFAGIPYLSNVAVDIDADIDADMAAQRFVLNDNRIQVNDLVLALAGSVARSGENLALDLTFEAPGSAFGEVLSLVPAVYAQDFASLETSGTMAVSGYVRGEYGKLAFPAFAVNVTVADGTFRYPDLPLPAREIAVDLAIRNPGGDADSTVVDLRRLHGVIGTEPMEASLVLRTPVSDPDVDLQMAGTVQLSDIGRTIKLQGVEELTGVVTADVAMRTRLSDVDAAAYDRIDAAGTVDVRDFALRSAQLPHALQIADAELVLTPQHAELTTFTGTIGSSDVQASGRLRNMLAFVLRDEDLRGTATVHSAHFDLDEWRSEKTERAVIPVPANVDFTLQATADRLTYGELDIANARGGLRIKDQRITLEDFRMEMLGGAAVATGYYETVTPAQPVFDVDMRLTDIDIPSAFAALTTVQMLAPVARYAQGSVSADVKLNGAMGENMMPVFDALTGLGSFETTRLVVQDFPAFGKLADALHVDQLRNPTLGALASSFEVRDGRVHVRPFDVNVGPLGLTVAGSNGIDRSLAYTLNVALPKSVLGPAANGVLTSLAAKTALAGVDVAGAERITVGVDVTGTVTDPVLALDLASAASSVTEGIEQALRDEADARVDDVRERADSAAAEARRRAEAQAAEIVAEAEERAAGMRAEARTLAEKVRREGYEKADSLEARATSPAARIGAGLAAKKLRTEADQAADRMVLEADARAEALVTEARRQADALVQQ